MSKATTEQLFYYKSVRESVNYASRQEPKYTTRVVVDGEVVVELPGLWNMMNAKKVRGE